VLSYKPVKIYHKAWSILVFVLVWGLPLAALYGYWRFGEVSPVPLTLFAVGMAIFAWPAAFITDSALPSAVSDDGVSGYTGFSLPKKVAWDRIHGVKRLNLWPCMPYLVVLDGSGLTGRILLPIFSTNQKAFYEKVVELQGEGHPLAVGLREHGFAT
jgi:hypothetical protein